MKLIRKFKEDLQVRQVVLRARRKPDITLFPMIHVGDAAYFRNVARQANAHDLVLAEGLRARQGRVANLSHRIASIANPDLAAQSHVFKQSRDGASSAPGKWLNSDISQTDFQSLWAEIPLWGRLMFYVVLPLFGLALRFRKVRERLAHALSRGVDNDPDSLDEVFGTGFADAVVHARDKALLRHAEAAIEAGNAKSIAVVWGAAHMPALISSLAERQGYRVASGTWITALADPARKAAQPKGNSLRPATQGQK